MREKITSVHNPKIRSIVRLEKKGDRDDTGLLVIEGVREIGLAIQSKLKLTEVLHCPDVVRNAEEKRLLDELRGRSVPLTAVSAAAFAKIAYREGSGGLVAIAERPSAALRNLPERKHALYAVIDAVEKPGNLGAILRTADGAGATGLIVTDVGTDLFGSNVIRASLGTVFSVPIATASAAEATGWLKRKKVRIIALSPHADTLYTEADLTRSCAVVLGSESRGASDSWMTAADERVRIPMRGRADSLNVSTSAAIILYEALRQRTTAGRIG